MLSWEDFDHLCRAASKMTQMLTAGPDGNASYLITNGATVKGRRGSETALME